MPRDKTPSVTMLTNEYPPNVYGGAGVHVQYLSAALSRLTEVEVRSFGSSRPGGDVPAHAFAAGADWRAEAGARIGRVLNTLAIDLSMSAPPINTDVVHCHTWYTMFAGLLARILYQRPLVATVHSLEPLRPWKEEQLGTGYALSTWLERTGLLAADVVIAVSAEMRRDILHCYPVSPGRIRVIHNGVDAERFHHVEEREALSRRHISPPYALFVGRISRQKGLDVLLEAAPLFPRGLSLVVCAGAPDTTELAEELREKAGRLANVIWIEEMVPMAELVQLYSHAVLFVCPSIYEPFGLINLEAMACDKPVVACAVGGIPEVVVDGETGLLVPPGDAGAFAVAVGRLAGDPQIAAVMGHKGRLRVESMFTWQAIASRTLEAYRDATLDFNSKSPILGVCPSSLDFDIPRTNS